VNDCVLGLDEFSVEISFRHDSEKDMNPEVWEFPSELYFVVSESTLIAEEGTDDDLSEEGNFSEQESSVSIFLAVSAQTFDDGGWVSQKLTLIIFFDVGEDDFRVVLLFHHCWQC
jgi:hypothetical protein